jgi:hypothetical protein
VCRELVRDKRRVREEARADEWEQMWVRLNPFPEYDCLFERLPHAILA